MIGRRVGFPQLRHVESGLARCIENDFLAPGHEIDCRGHFLERRVRNHDRTMMIGVHDVVAGHGHPQHVDLRAEVDYLHEAVARRDYGGDALKLRTHHIHVAHRSVGDRAHAAQPPVHVGIDLTPERAEATLTVDVLHHEMVGWSPCATYS